MMSGSRKKIYWDTCVFLAWIKQEICWPEEVTKGIKQTIEQWRSGEVLIVTSSITMLEILSSHLTITHKDEFSKAFSNPNLQLVDVDRRVSGKASVIRQHYDDRVFNNDGSIKSGRVIGMGDAIHLATALNFEVTQFQTLDGSGKRKRKFDLLALDGSVAGARLEIRLPKYLPPPVFSEGPITPVGGLQASFYYELTPLMLKESDHLMRIVAVLKTAIDNGYFKNEDINQ